MDKHVKKGVIEKNLQLATEAGIWNHVMALYGFPGETREEAEETRQFRWTIGPTFTRSNCFTS